MAFPRRWRGYFFAKEGETPKIPLAIPLEPVHNSHESTTQKQTKEELPMMNQTELKLRIELVKHQPKLNEWIISRSNFKEMDENLGKKFAVDCGRNRINNSGRLISANPGGRPYSARASDIVKNPKWAPLVQQLSQFNLNNNKEFMIDLDALEANEDIPQEASGIAVASGVSVQTENTSVKLNQKDMRLFHKKRENYQDLLARLSRTETNIIELQQSKTKADQRINILEMAIMSLRK
jgi:hypothetical protein